MFDPERMLGQLLTQGLGRKRGLGRLLGGRPSAGLGLLGVAIAAFEHFSQQSSATSVSSVGTAEPAQPTPPAVPPPLPPSSRGVEPVSAGPSADDGPVDQAASHPEMVAAQDAIWLIRAMIAAAAADGQIDAQERNKILTQSANHGLSNEEREFLLQELDRPRSLFELVAATTTDELRQQMFAASWMAIDADTAAEQQYLQSLATALHLTDQQVTEIQRQIGE